MAYILNCPTKNEVEKYFQQKSNTNHLLVHCQKGKDNVFITYQHEGQLIHLQCPSDKEGCIAETIDKDIPAEILATKHLITTSIVDIAEKRSDDAYEKNGRTLYRFATGSSVWLKKFQNSNGCCGVVPARSGFRFCKGSCRSGCNSCYRHRTYPFWNVMKNGRGSYTFVPPPCHCSKERAIALFTKQLSKRKNDQNVDSILYMTKEGSLESLSTAELSSMSTAELNSLLNQVEVMPEADTVSSKLAAGSQNMFTVITQNRCKYCTDATDLLQSANIPFETVNATAELAKKYQISTTPHILFSDSSTGRKKVIGGLDELRALLDALSFLNTVVYWKKNSPTFAAVYNHKRFSPFRYCGKKFTCGKTPSNLSQIKTLIDQGVLSQSDVNENKTELDIKADQLIRVLQQLKKKRQVRFE